MSWELLGKAGGWLYKNWAKVRPWITPQAFAGRKPIPTETFRIVLDTEDPPWWHMGGHGNEPATQIHARCFVTNISGQPALVTQCKLRPKGSDKSYDMRKIIDQLPRDRQGSHTAIMLVNDFVHPAITKKGETLEAEIIVVDQFGNENVGPMVTFPEH